MSLVHCATAEKDLEKNNVHSCFDAYSLLLGGKKTTCFTFGTRVSILEQVIVLYFLWYLWNKVHCFLLIVMFLFCEIKSVSKASRVISSIPDVSIFVTTKNKEYLTPLCNVRNSREIILVSLFNGYIINEV